MVRNFLIVLGSIVAVLPYLGFPHRIDDIVSTTAGVLIVLLVLFARRKSSRRRQPVAEAVAMSPERTDVVELVAPPDVPVMVHYEDETEDHHPHMKRPEAELVPVQAEEHAPLTHEYYQAEMTPVEAMPHSAPRKRRSVMASLMEDDVPPAHLPITSSYQEVEEVPVVKPVAKKVGRPKKIKHDEVHS